MFVRERMTKPALTIHADMPMQDALALMQKEQIRRLPVTDDKGKMIGIVTESDLLHASPSDATSLSIYEINYLLSKITVDKIMATEVISVDEDIPIEEAARMLVDARIGGMPVLRGDELVGMITETDLFKVFLELLGAREIGVRLTVLLPDVRGELAKITGIIRNAGGNIVALVQSLAESPGKRSVTLKASTTKSTARV